MPLFFGSNFFLMLSPYYRHTRRSQWLPLISVGINGLVVIVSFIATIALMGWELTERTMWSIPYLFRIVHLEGIFIEKVGLSMIIFSIFLI
ncbi:GerAB/ArcD/ProY family transporter [Paenibacillus macerans]|uniref:GerAB/ArcD/ProY family transporter n=1 Tax=Paenibacillus macerans TaxID=44252 RepID=UPI003D31C695